MPAFRAVNRVTAHSISRQVIVAPSSTNLMVGSELADIIAKPYSQVVTARKPDLANNIGSKAGDGSVDSTQTQATLLLQCIDQTAVVASQAQLLFGFGKCALSHEGNSHMRFLDGFR